jgi:hypothetical protein
MSTATTTSRFVEYLLPAANASLRYGQMILKDIPAEKFAHCPKPGMSHPAFYVGHLSLYPNRLLEFTGQKHLIVERPGYAELFQAGAECVEQDGRYPSKDDLVPYYIERYTTFIGTLPGIDDDVFQRINPREGRFRELFPTVGAVVTFMLTGHHMSHLGQISMWRRAIGLPPAA